jgi:hypothetical protein
VAGEGWGGALVEDAGAGTSGYFLQGRGAESALFAEGEGSG